MRQNSDPAPHRWPWAKKILFSLIPTLLLVLLLVGVEAVMTHTGRGVSADPFETPPHAPELRRDNRDFVFKYHPVSRHSRTNFHRNLFTAEKAAGTLRGVVLGGSTAEGFPYFSGHGFSGVLAASLTAATGRPVEIVNLGFSAMSSYYVRDVARKLADLDLDFAVIYTGHNEYYGTISYSSGSGHLAKLVNMRLKDWRLFQAIYGMMAPAAPVPGQTLMSRQFSQHRFEPDARRQQEVADRLLDNLNAAVGALTGDGMKVFVVEPVCNLVDMPPFVSRGEPGLDAALVAAAQAVVKGLPGADQAWLAEPSLTAREADDPVAAYAGARARLATGHFDLAGFTRAKDLDPAPFRARSSLIAALDDWVRSDRRAELVPLARYISDHRGAAAQSDELFIDHLHFNHRGNVLAARAIAHTMAASWPDAGIDSTRLDLWFADSLRVDRSVNFLRAFDLHASRRVAELVAGPPYTDMVLPYRSPGSASGLDAGMLASPEFRQHLAQVPEGDMLMVYGNQMIKDKQLDAALHFVNAMRYVDPGSFGSHLAAGHFLLTLGKPQADEAALAAYSLALKLVDDPRRLAGQIRSYMTRRGRGDLAGRLPRP